MSVLIREKEMEGKRDRERERERERDRERSTMFKIGREKRVFLSK
jgi:hypothetical protein